MLPKISFMLCIAILASYISQTSSKVIHLEAENGSYTGSKMDRSAASGQATVHLNASQYVNNTFTTGSSCSVAIQDVTYTNDGGSDDIEVHIDGILIGYFNTTAASNRGENWNVTNNTGMIGENRKINSGSHQLLLKAVKTDSYGVELDKTILNLTCTGITSQTSESPFPSKPTIQTSESPFSSKPTSQASQSPFSNKCTAFMWTIMAVFVLFHCYNAS